jgi:regulatory protein
VKRSPSPPSGTPYHRALQRLARRDHSEAEIRRALARDGFPAEAIEATVQRLRAARYLDDDGFAARYATSRMRHQGLGRYRVRQDLQRKGVATKAAEAGVREALGEVSEADTIDALARRYWKARATDEPARRVRKLWAFLLRRGFPADLVQARLRALWPRWKDALDGLEPIDDPEDGHRE